MKKIGFALGLCVVLIMSAFTGCSPDTGGSSGGKSAEELGLMAEGVLRVGMEIDYPPFAQRNEDGAAIGLDVELAEAIAEILGVGVQLEDIARADLAGSLDAGQIDCVISAAIIDPELAETMDFSDPYCSSWQTVLVKAGVPAIESLEELDGLTVGYLQNSVSEQLFKQLSAEETLSSTAVQYQGITECLDDLRMGRIDAVLCGSAEAGGRTKAEPGTFDTAWSQSAEEGAEAGMMAVAVKKGNANLISAVNDALTQMIESGKLFEIRRKWTDK